MMEIHNIDGTIQLYEIWVNCGIVLHLVIA